MHVMYELHQVYFDLSVSDIPVTPGIIFNCQITIPYTTIPIVPWISIKYSLSPLSSVVSYFQSSAP